MLSWYQAKPCSKMVGAFGALKSTTTVAMISDAVIGPMPRSVVRRGPLIVSCAIHDLRFSSFRLRTQLIHHLKSVASVTVAR
jgi:hypothetical protein